MKHNIKNCATLLLEKRSSATQVTPCNKPNILRSRGQQVSDPVLVASKYAVMSGITRVNEVNTLFFSFIPMNIAFHIVEALMPNINRSIFISILSQTTTPLSERSLSKTQRPVQYPPISSLRYNFHTCINIVRVNVEIFRLTFRGFL